MGKERFDKIKSFACGVTAPLSAVIWCALYTPTLWEILIITGVAVAVQLIPIRRCWQIELLLMLIGVGAASSGSVDLLSRTFEDVSFYMWWIGWLWFAVLLFYVGEMPIYRAVLPLSLTAVAGAILSFGGGIVCFDGEAQWGTVSLAKVISGIVVLWGSSAVGRNMAKHSACVSLGSAAGCVLWGLIAVTPLLVWSREAMGPLRLPLVSAWQNIGFSADIWLTVLFCLCALWLMGGARCIYHSIKSHSFTNEI